MKRRRVDLPLVFAGCLVLAARADGAISLRVASSAALPADTIARDVRWASPSEVYVGLGVKGAIRARVDTPSQFTTIMPPGDRGGFFLSSLVAAGQKHLVVGSPYGGFAWMPLGSGTAAKTGQKGLVTVMDLDAFGDRVAILGADSGEVHGLAREGTIAWTGTLSKGLADFRPLMTGRAKPGGKDMARCGILETGAIRFLRDGSVIVVPGVEPGIFRYDPAGKLLKTWDTGPLGIIDDCAVEDKELMLLARDFASRTQWLASRVMVDDVLPFLSGAALVLRRVEKGTTKWDIVTLPAQGNSERVAIPVTMPSPRGHVRGDVRGNQLVLLVFEDPLPGQKAVAPPRLFVLSVAQ